MKWIVTYRVNDVIERKECDTEEQLKAMAQLALRRDPQYVSLRPQNDRLFDWILSEFQSVLGMDFSREPIALKRIREEAERAEDALSSSEEYEITLASIAAAAIGPQKIELTREKLAADGVPIGKTWTVNWGNDGEFGRCDIIGQHSELLNFVSELMKRSPREVSIAAPSALPDRGDDIPYAAIAYALKNGDFVPFLGAGVSASARQPADAR